MATSSSHRLLEAMVGVVLVRGSTFRVGSGVSGTAIKYKENGEIGDKES